MAVELIISPEALQDLASAYDWYDSQRAGLGEEFLSCVDACIHAICRDPEIFEKVLADYRRALVRRFPYAVFYEYESRIVTVYCIFHTSRHPEKWRQRLP
jgi:plasmid stabilization system protein ParE